MPPPACTAPLIGRRQVIELWGTGGLAWLLGTAAAYMTGILTFRFGGRTATNRGKLAR